MALPSGTTGSLRPTFVPARPIGLAVKHPYTFTLDARLPTGLRVPLHSSVLRVTPIRGRSIARTYAALPFPFGSGRVVIGGRAFLPASSRRREARTVSSSHLRSETFGVQSLRIPRVSIARWHSRPFLLIVRTQGIFTGTVTLRHQRLVAWDTRMFQHIAEYCSYRHR